MAGAASAGVGAHRLDAALTRGRLSLRARRARLQAKSWQIAQCAVAAAVAWFIARDLLGHPTPFFAPIAAVLGLGTSYGQRLRRVAEVTVGVAVGVLVGDLLVLGLGSGAWQVGLVVALAMTVGFLLDGGQLLVNQAAVQSIFVTTIVVAPGEALVRWTDALVGGAVALVAATVVPAAPLRRPREQAALVVDKIARLLRAAAEVVVDAEVETALELLADARATDHLINELQAAADEGLSVVASSPFRVRQRATVRRVADLVVPLDRALRSTRVLTRQAAVCAYRRRPVPRAYSVLCLELADACDEVATELRADRMAVAARDALLAVGHHSAGVERTDDLPVEVVLAQIRSVVVDLLQVTGLDALEATDALPPARH
jgi:uncharacterized membrane protein YgaE (UPF0421/DUF939 family)